MTLGARPRILVTRAEPGAGETAARLTARGLDPVVEPLLALQRIAAGIPPFDALAFTSANGVRVFADLSARRDVPVFCVGARTADVARKAGFGDVASANGDVGALADLVRARLPADARLLHAGNEDARGDLSGRLQRAGLKAAFAPIYRSEPATTPGPALAAHLSGAARLDAALVHSPAAAVVLGDFLANRPNAPPLAIAAISEAAVPAGRGSRTEVAAAPNETALLAALDALLGADPEQG